MLCDYVNATIGFRALGKLTDKSPKSLMRMLGPHGNPQARDLLEIIGCLQEREGLHLKVQAGPVGGTMAPRPTTRTRGGTVSGLLLSLPPVRGLAGMDNPGCNGDACEI